MTQSFGEARQPSFAIDASEVVEATARRNGVRLQSDLMALHALAARIGVDLPAEPRILLMDTYENPHTSEVIIMRTDRPQRYLPTRRDENDLIVRLREPLSSTRQLNQRVVTESIARVLVDEKRSEQDVNGKRASSLGIAAGALFGGLMYAVFHNQIGEDAGLGLIVLGLAGLTYFSNRGPAELPSLEGLRPPIRLQSRHEPPLRERI